MRRRSARIDDKVTGQALRVSADPAERHSTVKVITMPAQEPSSSW